LADVEFRSTGLAPSHAFLLMLVAENPGVAQKEASRSLQLAPSTVTRMVDALAQKKLVTRTTSGRTTMVSPTKKGTELLPAIHEAWWSLRRSYCKKLGDVEGDELARRIDEARTELEE
jgi:DNA-binding MarR family transcriptional regulator